MSIFEKILDRENWVKLGLLNESSSDFSAYNKDIGLYSAYLNDTLVYIGKATELYNGGFRKRLRDYTRTSSSARNFPAGELMFKHRNELEIEIYLFSRSLSIIDEIATYEDKLIQKLEPNWN